MHRPRILAGIPVLALFLALGSPALSAQAARGTEDALAGNNRQPPVPAATAVTAAVPTAVTADVVAGVAGAVPADGPVGYRYIIQEGDTLWDIAWAHDLTVEELVAANPVLDATLLQLGQAIFVPAAPQLVLHAAAAANPELTAPADDPPTAAPDDAGNAEPDAAPVAKTPAEAPPADQQSAAASPSLAPAAEQAPAGQTPADGQPAAEQAPAEQAPAAESQSPAPTEAPTQAPTPTAETPAAPSPEPAGWVAALLDLMNARRTAAGLPALAWSPELASAAQAHADDCGQRGWGSHVGSDGAVLKVRLARAGYAAKWAGENWANALNAAQAFSMWWNEGPGGPHRQGILNPLFSEVGIGVAAGSWGYYFITDFGSR